MPTSQKIETEYCCKQMTRQVNHKCEIHVDNYECPDALIDYSIKFDEYGIIIHDGGTSKISISYCPFCGKKLPDSKRDLWFDTLEKLGFQNPFEDELPKEFYSNKWYLANEHKTKS
jgi:hypothetical protein